MQHGVTLKKNVTLQLFENARYLPFGSVFNLHVFIYDPVDSSLSKNTTVITQGCTRELSSNIYMF